MFVPIQRNRTSSTSDASSSNSNLFQQSFKILDSPSQTSAFNQINERMNLRNKEWQSEVERLRENFFSPPSPTFSPKFLRPISSLSSASSIFLSPPISPSKCSSPTEEDLHVQFDLKNFTLEEIRIEIDGRKLLVSAQHNQQENNRKLTRSFERRIDIPLCVDISALKFNISADNLLTVSNLPNSSPGNLKVDNFNHLVEKQNSLENGIERLKSSTGTTRTNFFENTQRNDGAAQSVNSSLNISDNRVNSCSNVGHIDSSSHEPRGYKSAFTPTNNRVSLINNHESSSTNYSAFEKPFAMPKNDKFLGYTNHYNEFLGYTNHNNDETSRTNYNQFEKPLTMPTNNKSFGYTNHNNESLGYTNRNNESLDYTKQNEFLGYTKHNNDDEHRLGRTRFLDINRNEFDNSRVICRNGHPNKHLENKTANNAHANTNGLFVTNEGSNANVKYARNSTDAGPSFPQKINSFNNNESVFNSFNISDNKKDGAAKQKTDKNNVVGERKNKPANRFALSLNVGSDTKPEQLEIDACESHLVIRINDHPAASEAKEDFGATKGDDKLPQTSSEKDETGCSKGRANASIKNGVSKSKAVEHMFHLPADIKPEFLVAQFADDGILTLEYVLD